MTTDDIQRRNPDGSAPGVLDFLAPWAGRVAALDVDRRRRLQYADITHARGPVWVRDDLPSVQLSTSVLLANARLFLGRLIDSEQRVTAHGNLNRAFVLEMAAAMRLSARDEERRRHTKVNREADLPPLEVLRVVLQVGGLIRKYGGAFRVTRRGAELLAEGAAGELFAHLFRTFFGKFNLGYLDGWDDDAILQAQFPLYLWMISKLADGWLSVETLRELAVGQIDPRQVDAERRSSRIAPGTYFPKEELWRFESRIIEPLVDFGLLESRADPEDVQAGLPRYQQRRQVRKAPLFDRFVVFEHEAADRPSEAGNEAGTDRAKLPRVEPEDIARLKVSLQGIRPPIWRRLEVPLSFSFRRLSDVVVAAFGWSNSHLHAFEIGKRGVPGNRRIGMVDEMDGGLRFYGPPVEDDRIVRLSDTLKSGQRLLYEYDFGDSWRLEIRVEAIASAASGLVYPRVTDGRRAGPPEDCGGVWGYEEIIATLAGEAAGSDDPTGEEEAGDREEAEERLQWLRECYPYFAPEEFDLADTDERVRNPLEYWE